jgi:RNA ligase (TIGR02306 family)
MTDCLKSTHSVKVIKIKDIKKHPQADKLEVINIPEFGYTVVSQMGNYKEGDLAVYFQPDLVLPLGDHNPEFDFLKNNTKTHHRLTVKKLRNIYSQGLLVPARDGMNEGDEVSEVYGVYRYEPPEQSHENGKVLTGPFWVPKYDVESYRKFQDLIPLDNVICREKLHGTNWGGCFSGGEFHVRSRNNWYEETSSGLYWRGLSDKLREVLPLYPNKIFFGELVGQVGGFPYGAKGKAAVYLFDIWDSVTTKFVSPQDFQRIVDEHQLPACPLLYEGAIGQEKLFELAEGKSTLDGKTQREGIVLQPVNDIYNDELGRVKLKIVGNGYLEKGS